MKKTILHSSQSLLNTPITFAKQAMKTLCAVTILCMPAVSSAPELDREVVEVSRALTRLSTNFQDLMTDIDAYTSANHMSRTQVLIDQFECETLLRNTLTIAIPVIGALASVDPNQLIADTTDKSATVLGTLQATVEAAKVHELPRLADLLFRSFGSRENSNIHRATLRIAQEESDHFFKQLKDSGFVREVVAYKQSRGTLLAETKDRCDGANNFAELDAAEKDRNTKWQTLRIAAQELEIPMPKSSLEIEAELRKANPLYRNHVAFSETMKDLMRALNRIGYSFRV